jgi:O-acetyl-ADP-ribose deacetylase (regulator of RNase III)
MQTTINRTSLELVQGGIADMETDAIVNAANRNLAHGGGVAAAIVSQGGPEIQKESDAWVREHGQVPTGSAAITGAGRLAAKYVIHAVGPVYDGTYRSANKLASAVRSSLALADEYNLKSIALPAISTGIFGYPLGAAADVMLSEAVEYLQGETGLERVIFCLYDRMAFDGFVASLERITG